MVVDLRFTAALILASYALLAVLERVPGLRFKASRLLRPFFATDVGWYVAAVAVTLLFSPLLQSIPSLRASAGLPGLESADFPLLLLVGITLVLYDLGAFLAHVVLHRFEWLWRIHKVHHSTRTLDWLATTRAHASEHLFRNIPTQAVLFALGLPLEAIAIALGIYGAFAALGHSNLRGDFSVLEPLLITPRLHRLHHVPETTHRNFATVFSFWDRMAGYLVIRDCGVDEALGVPGEEQSYPQSWWPQLTEPFRFRRDAGEVSGTPERARP